MELYYYPLIVLAGFLTGFINTLAGAGSAVSLALLSFIGIPLDIANGTNRVAILMQNIVGVRGFHNHGMMNWSLGARLALPAAFGSMVGAYLATSMSREELRFVVGLLMVGVLILLFVRPKRWLEGQQALMKTNPDPGQYAVFFAIGIYGGFIPI